MIINEIFKLIQYEILSNFTYDITIEFIYEIQTYRCVRTASWAVVHSTIILFYDHQKRVLSYRSRNESVHTLLRIMTFSTNRNRESNIMKSTDSHVPSFPWTPSAIFPPETMEKLIRMYIPLILNVSRIRTTAAGYLRLPRNQWTVFRICGFFRCSFFISASRLLLVCPKEWFRRCKKLYAYRGCFFVSIDAFILKNIIIFGTNDNAPIRNSRICVLAQTNGSKSVYE